MTYHLAWNLGIKKFEIYIIILLLSHYRKNRVHLGKILKLENASSWLENKIKWDKKGKKNKPYAPFEKIWSDEDEVALLPRKKSTHQRERNTDYKIL